MVDVVVSGHLCLDLLPAMAHVPLESIASPGKLFEVDALDLSTGGSVSNTGLTLHILGVDVGLMGTVGDDLLGRVIIAFLKDHKPELGEMIKVQPGQSSSYTVVLSPENSDRIFLHGAGTNDTFKSEDVNYEMVSEAKIFHLGYPQLLPGTAVNDGVELVKIYQRVKEQGVITSLDSAMPDMSGVGGKVNWLKLHQDTLPYVDIFLPSVEEIVLMLRREDYEAWNGEVLTHISRTYLDGLADDLLKMGARIVGFKLGDLGFYLRTTDDPARLEPLQKLPLAVSEWVGASVYHPAFEVDVVGTTGAGDAAYGGFLTAMLHGLGPDKAVQMACAVGACNVEAPGSVGGILSWEDTEKRIASGWLVRSDRLMD